MALWRFDIGVYEVGGGGGVSRRLLCVSVYVCIYTLEFLQTQSPLVSCHGTPRCIIGNITVLDVEFRHLNEFV